MRRPPNARFRIAGDILKVTRPREKQKIPLLRALESGWPLSYYAQHIRDALKGRRSLRLELASKATLTLLAALDQQEDLARLNEQLKSALREREAALAEAYERNDRQHRAAIELNKTASARELPSPKSGLNLIEERNVTLVPKPIQGGAPR